jgi:hypothetical protein
MAAPKGANQADGPNDKNSIFESESSKKSRLIGLRDGWG